MLTRLWRDLMVTRPSLASGRPLRVAASLSCSVVTLLVCKMRMTSFADSWISISNVVTQAWMAAVVHASGASSLSDGWGGCRGVGLKLLGRRVKKHGWWRKIKTN